MADSPVDFRYLRTITGGDVAFEAELFAFFTNNVSVCMGALQDAVQKNDQKMWRQQAHALKGLSCNLGAIQLAALCEKAQIDWTVSTNNKTILLALISGEFARVKNCLMEETAKTSTETGLGQ